MIKTKELNTSNSRLNYMYNMCKWNQAIFYCFQKTIIEGDNTKFSCLNGNDVFLLSWMYNVYENTPEHKQKIIENENYVYINPEYVQKQLMILRLRKDTITRKIKKLCNFKIFKHWYDEKTQRHYYRPNKVITDIMLYSNNTNDDEVAENIFKLQEYLANKNMQIIDVLDTSFYKPLGFKSYPPSDLNPTPLGKKSEVINILNNNIYNKDILVNYINIIKTKLKNNFEINFNSNLDLNKKNNKDSFPIPFPKEKELNANYYMHAPNPALALNAEPETKSEEINEKKPITLTKNEIDQLPLIHFWNDIAKGQRENKYKNKMSIHKIPDDISTGVSKTIKSICSMLYQLRVGSFLDKRNVKDIDKIPMQTEIEIKSIVTDYSKLFISGYSFTKYEIKKESLMTSFLMFLYNYRSQKSYYATLITNPVKMVNEKLLDSIDISDNILKEYKKLFSTAYWEQTKESIYYQLDQLQKKYNGIQKSTSILYQLNIKYKTYFETLEKFVKVHIKFLKSEFSFVSVYKTGHLSIQGLMWEKFQKYIKDQYQIVFAFSQKQKIRILKHEKINAITRDVKKPGEFLGYHLLDSLSEDQIKSIGAREINSKELKLTDLNQLFISADLKEYFLNNFDVIDDTNVHLPGTGDIFEYYQDQLNSSKH